MRRRVRRTAPFAVPIAAAVLAAPAAPAQQGSSEPTAGTAHVVAVESRTPAERRVFRHRFRPWAKPTRRQVREIIRAESRRWRVAPGRLARRVRCESRFDWRAGNGSFRGLLQFHPSTFQRGLRTIRDRRVVLRRERTRTARSTRIVRYSDGRTVRTRGRRHRQRIVHIYVGRLPRTPGVLHGWAQLRIGAQSIRGVSAVRSSEWTCPA